MLLASAIKNKYTRDKALRMLRYAFSHHPLCSQFRDHVYNVKGFWVCKGCGVTYPTSIFSFIIAFLIGLKLTIAVELTALLLFISLTISLLDLLLEIGMIKRIVLGLFSGMFFFSLISYGDLVIFLQGILMFYLILMPLTFLRYYRMKKICNECKYKGNWNECEGFLDLRRELFKNTVWESEYNNK